MSWTELVARFVWWLLPQRPDQSLVNAVWALSAAIGLLVLVLILQRKGNGR